MGNNNATAVGIAITIIFVLFAVMVVTIIATMSISKDRKPVEEWCEVGVHNPDGSITYHGIAGSEELVAFATADGPKLMRKCNK